MKKINLLLPIFSLLLSSVFAQKTAQQTLRQANAAAEAGDFKQAAGLAEAILDKKNLSKNLKNQVRSDLAFFKIQLGAFAAAAPLLADAEQFFQKNPGEDNSDLATVWARLGSLAMEQKKYPTAELFFNRAKNLREQQMPARHLDFAESLDQLGELFLETGRLDSADQILAKAAQLAPPRHWLRAQILNNQARVQIERSQFEPAEKNFRLSLDLQKKLSRTQHPLFAKTLMNFANLQIQLGQLAAAKTNFEAALRLFRQGLGEQHSDFARATNNLASVQERLGNYPEAARNYRHAADIFEKNELREDFLIAQFNVGVMYKQSGQPDSAVIFLEKNMVEWQKLKGTENSDFAWIQILLAESLVETGDPAKFELARALALAADQLFARLMTESHADMPHFSVKKALVFEKSGLPHEAKKEYARTARLVQQLANEFYPMLSDAERGHFLRENLQYFSQFVFHFGARHAGSLDLEMLDLEAALKGLSLEMSRIAQWQASVLGDSDLQKAFEKWQNARELLVAAHFSGGRGRVDSLHLAADLLEKELSQAVFKKGKNRAPRRVAPAQNLPEGAAVVDYFKSQGEYFAIVRTADTLATVRLDSVMAVDLSLIQEVESAASYVRNRAGRRRLAEQLWHPVEPFLKNVRTVFISPTGRLHRLAFHLLPPSEAVGNDSFLFEKYAIKICLSPADAAGSGGNIDWQNRRVELLGGAFFDEQNVAAASLPDFDSRAGELDLSRSMSFGFLPGTLAEVDSLAKFFRKNGWQAAKYTGIAASEAQLRNCRTTRPEILHIASHGFFFVKKKPREGAASTLENRLRQAESPMLRSGLALASANKSWRSAESAAPENDGIVSALEIAGMDFSSVRLVALSACETARGDADDTEGVFGLQRGFRQAGAGVLLASLWKVPDLATSRLMLLFYQNLIETNDPHAALRQAQLSMHLAGEEPFFWAGFVVLD